MFFFFKRKKIVVDCFNTSKTTIEIAPIEKAVNFYPDWWKKIPDSFYEANNDGVKLQIPTIKRCVAFTDLYKNGFIMPLWTDMIIETVTNNYVWAFADERTIIQSHDSKQFGNQFPDFMHIKIRSPWKIREKTGIEFLWMEPIWNNIKGLNKFYVLPGVLNYKYQHATEVNMFIPNCENKIDMKTGNPLVHLVPLTEKDVELRHHLIDEKEIEDLYDAERRLHFINNYRKNVTIRKNKEKKCPFGFGK